jgi:hypothetical protein
MTFWSLYGVYICALPISVVSHIVPTQTVPDSSGFFNAAERGELAVRFCRCCDAVIHLPRAYCAGCGRWDTEFRPVDGRGRLYSWTVVRHTGHPAFPVPYTVVLVELEAHPSVRFAGHLPGAPALEIGMAMRLYFEPVGGTGVRLPNWAPGGR